MPHIVQTALPVWYLTFFPFWNFSPFLTLFFKGHLCFAEVLLTPDTERLCLELFQCKSSPWCFWWSLAPVVLNTSTFVFATVNDSNRELLLLVGYRFYVIDQLVLHSNAVLGHWVLRASCPCLGFVELSVSLKSDGGIGLKTNVVFRSLHSWHKTALLVNGTITNLHRGAWKY